MGGHQKNKASYSRKRKHEGAVEESRKVAPSLDAVAEESLLPEEPLRIVQTSSPRTSRDVEDWMFHRVLFRDISQTHGPFSLDLCADPAGLNSQVSRYYSCYG